MNSAQEDRLATILAFRPDLLTSDQKKLAEAMHTCRSLRDAEHACKAIQDGVSGMCERCLQQEEN